MLAKQLFTDEMLALQRDQSNLAWLAHNHFGTAKVMSQLLEDDKAKKVPSTLERMDEAQKIQLLPASPNLPRVETGAVQFGDDHPGLFIRGDNAVHLMIMIQDLDQRLADHMDDMVHDRMDAVNRYATIIEEDVKYRTS